MSSLAVTGNISAANVTANLFGNGAAISSITGANVTGTVANATYATTAGSAGSATTAVTVTGNAQPNITSVGTLTSLAVTGNISAANVTANLFGNGAAISSITGANVTGTVANATYATSAGTATTAGTVTTNAQPNITSVGTLTSLTVNGLITALTSATTTGTTITPTAGSTNQYEVTALATGATIAAPSGTPVDGQRLILRIKDNGTPQTLTWTTSSGAYRARNVTLPTTTVASTPMYIGCIYNTQDTFWDVLAVTN